MAITALYYRHLWLLLALAGLTACVEPIEVRVPETAKSLVVDGRITNEPGPYTVRLTYTSAYAEGSAGVNLMVNGANVIISDDAGTSEALTEKSPGVYVTQTSGIQGQIGRSYTISIQTPDGRKYQSRPDLLKPVAAIDSVYTSFNDGSNGQPRGFRVFLDVQDPATTNDFYRWDWTHYRHRVYCNEEEDFNVCCGPCWAITRCTDCIIIGADNLVNGNKISGQLLTTVPYSSISKYFLLIEQASLTKEAYRFWNAVAQQSKGVGSTFDPPPAPIPGNIYCVSDPDVVALGFFWASGITTRSVAIRREGVGQSPDGSNFPPPPREIIGLPPRCLPCPETPSNTAILPKGWIW